MNDVLPEVVKSTIPALLAPYPGLRPFEEYESSLFFGRGDHLAGMLKLLRKEHFLAVVGSSGCGKSSLARAGLLPALHQKMIGGADSDWHCVVIKPGSSPYRELALQLVKLRTPETSDKQASECGTVVPTVILALRPTESSDGQAARVAFCESTLRRGPGGLLSAIRDLLLPSNARFLVLIDQFEELFRYGSVVLESMEIVANESSAIAPETADQRH